MPWTEERKNQEFLHYAISGEMNPRNNQVETFTTGDSKINTILWLTSTLLKNLDNSDLVSIEFPRQDLDSERTYGVARAFSFDARFSVAKSDEEKIGKDDKTTIKLYTNVYPGSKKDFIDFFEKLKAVLEKC